MVTNSRHGIHLFKAVAICRYIIVAKIINFFLLWYIASS